MKHAKKAAFFLCSQILLICLSPVQLVTTAYQRLILKDNIAIITLKQAYAIVLTTVDEFVHKTYPGDITFESTIHQITPDIKARIKEQADVTLDENLDAAFHFRVIQKSGNIIGYVVEDYVRGKWDPIHYALAITPEGAVKSVAILEYREKRGKPVAKTRFLKQFRGKTITDSIEVMKDIKGITGASISSNGVTNGIRKLLHLFQEFYS
ncbi:MAG: Na+-translocating ferredoxin:NAD+ oxidoreductase RnfG subunit [Candidatus Omnitrophota bacterium]|jgi:Na+-translocating ferredoxin:NAD+ oxidoreductase RnfG subunit